ncbi:MAG: ABC transporter ATP-binding protein [Candidatus Fimimonas sp.]
MKTLVTKKQAKEILKENNNRLVDENLTSFVSLQKVNKVYPNGVHAVYDFDLEVNKHDFVALVGPSGCGKSTTLRMIAGLEDISSGSLYIDKAYSNFLQSKDRNIAMVFQSYALYPQMSVFDNIAFGLKIRKLPKKEIEERVYKAADILDLGDYLDRKPKELSGGQMQRVALGRAIVRQADLFLMDEPLSNLDAKLRVQMRSEIIRIHKEVGATTIYVTHDQTEAMTMANVIVVMNKGFIQQVGKAIDVYNHPNNLFVATFIGSPAMNVPAANYNCGKLTFDNGFTVDLPSDFHEKYLRFVNGKLEELQQAIDNFDSLSDETIARMKAAQIYKKEEKKKAETTKKKTFGKKTADEAEQKRAAMLAELNSLREHYQKALQGGVVKVGIRPENVYVSENFSGEVKSAEFSATPTLVELLGSENILHFDLFGADFQVKTQQVGITTETETKLAFDVSKIHVFDVESGLAIK